MMDSLSSPCPQCGSIRKASSNIHIDLTNAPGSTASQTCLDCGNKFDVDFGEALERSSNDQRFHAAPSLEPTTYEYAWQVCSSLIAQQGLSIAVESREYTLEPAQTILDVFEALNRKSLASFHTSVQEALRELAARIAEVTGGITTLAVTRVEPAEVALPGLRIDADRLTILALAARPGSASFITAMHKHYTQDPILDHLYYMTGIQFPVTSGFRWFIFKIPSEHRTAAENIALSCGMELTDSQTLLQTLAPSGERVDVPYPPSGPGTCYLINEPGSSVYNDPQSGPELNRIERMMLE